jgi:ubiquinone/menaquinone biosynthesis C-methylase UbiE
MTTPDGGLNATFYDTFFSDPLYADFYGGSGFANFGYWSPGIADAASASRELVRRIAGSGHKPGAALDVGCGIGTCTNEFTRYFDAVTGINVDPQQIAAAKRRWPQLDFRVMDAARLQFDDESFDHVVSVEAAFHFRTRARFFAEAFRVLRPGGELALSDLLMAAGAPLTPAENYVGSLTNYRALLVDAGFCDVEIVDATYETWHTYRRRFTSFAASRMDRWLTLSGMRALYTLNVNSSWAIRACVLVRARRPR